MVQIDCTFEFLAQIVVATEWHMQSLMAGLCSGLSKQSFFCLSEPPSLHFVWSAVHNLVTCLTLAMSNVPGNTGLSCSPCELFGLRFAVMLYCPQVCGRAVHGEDLCHLGGAFPPYRAPHSTAAACIMQGCVTLQKTYKLSVLQTDGQHGELACQTAEVALSADILGKMLISHSGD